MKYKKFKAECPICEKEIDRALTDWNFYCKNDKHWISNLKSNIDISQNNKFNQIKNNVNLVDDLQYLRTKNFNKILDLLCCYKKNEDLKVLDIGCGTGLFLQEAKNRNIDVLGIEPNKVMFDSRIDKALNILNGYFPDVLENNQKFSVVIFNDVFEHIEDVNLSLKNCKNYLVEKGLVIFNIPNSEGGIFRVGKLLQFFKFKLIWNRLWQKNYYTPHLHYFSPKSLKKLGLKMQFKTIYEGELPAVTLKGLWKRVINDNNNFFVNIFVYVCLIIIYPFLKWCKSDVMLIIMQRN